MIQILNGGEGCKIDEAILNINDTIDFIANGHTKATIGRVKSFKTAPGDDSSVWMLVAELSPPFKKEYISVRLWAVQKENGLFKPIEKKAYVSPKYTDAQLPF